uniref:Galectin n=1 Tax=Ciona savignyi TaxID=51511 RepID=H2YEF7_CIOSA
MTQPIVTNPVVPFTEHVNGVFPGRTFTIVGTVLSNATRFSLNLMHADDIGFHFNPRLEEGVVVLNSRVAGEWQSDKRHPLTGSEFKLGEQFKIMLYCQDNKIRVFVNDKYLTKLKHRVELYKISHINMEGDMSVQSLEFGMMGKYPDTGIHILDAVPNQPYAIPFPNINFLGKDERDIAFHINPRERCLSLHLRFTTWAWV